MTQEQSFTQPHLTSPQTHTHGHRHTNAQAPEHTPAPTPSRAPIRQSSRMIVNKHTRRKAILIASTETGTDGLLGFTCRSGSAASAVFVFLLSHQPERCHDRPPNREWQTQMQTQKQMQTHMHAHTHTLTNPHKLTHIHSSAFAGTLIKREARTRRRTRTHICIRNRIRIRI